MVEVTAAPKKQRQSKPGTKRVVVTMAEAQYKRLAAISESQMREPNNMLTFILKDNIDSMLTGYEAIEQ